MSLQGLDNEQIHSITRIRYIVHECLRDQAGSVVTVASSPPETENCNKRGRGKEKVRRKGMGKRRRKDELEQCEEDSISRDDRLIPNYAATGIEYVEQMHHPIHLVNHQHRCHPNVASVNEEMDDSRLSISVNEVVGDAQICLQESEVDGLHPSNFADHEEEDCPPSDEDTKLDDHENGFMPGFASQEEPNQLSDEDIKLDDHENGSVSGFSNQEELNQLSDEDIKLDEHGTSLIRGEDNISSPHTARDESDVLPYESDEDNSPQSENGI